MRPRTPRRVRRPVAPARRGLGAAHGDRAGPAALDGALRAARVGQDDARADRRRALAGGVRGAERRAGRARRGARGDRARRAPPLARPRRRRRERAHGPLPRRDPPLQQGPAGRAAAGRRGGPGDADRRDHREPRVRGQRRAALAPARVRAAGAQRRRGRRAAAPRGAAPSVDDDAIEFLAARSEGDARTALNALELARARPRAEPTARRARDARARRGRAAAARGALRQRRRPPLRLHLGLDQGDARLGPGRLAVLPRGDARGRRGPALHRAADGDPRLRGHRQRRPGGAVGRDRRGGGGRARRPARGDATRSRRRRSTWRSRRSPNAAGRALGAARRHVREHGAQPAPPWLRSGPRPGQDKADYDNPHRHPGHLGPQALLPEGVAGERFYAARRGRGRARARGCARFAGRAGSSSDNRRDERDGQRRRRRARVLQARDPATGEPLGSVAATRAGATSPSVVADVAKVQPLWALLRVRTARATCAAWRRR